MIDICKAFDLILQNILIFKKILYCLSEISPSRTMLLLSSKSQKCFISGKSSLHADIVSGRERVSLRHGI